MTEIQAGADTNLKHTAPRLRYQFISLTLNEIDTTGPADQIQAALNFQVQHSIGENVAWENHTHTSVLKTGQ